MPRFGPRLPPSPSSSGRGGSPSSSSGRAASLRDRFSGRSLRAALARIPLPSLRLPWGRASGGSRPDTPATDTVELFDSLAALDLDGHGVPSSSFWRVGGDDDAGPIGSLREALLASGALNGTGADRPPAVEREMTSGEDDGASHAAATAAAMEVDAGNAADDTAAGGGDLAASAPLGAAVHAAAATLLATELESSNGRNQFSPKQRAYLEATWRQDTTPKPAQRHALAAFLKLSERQVRNWFGNRRRHRRVAEEKDSHLALSQANAFLQEALEAAAKQSGELETENEKLRAELQVAEVALADLRESSSRFEAMVTHR